MFVYASHVSVRTAIVAELVRNFCRVSWLVQHGGLICRIFYIYMLYDCCLLSLSTIEPLHILCRAYHVISLKGSLC